MTEPTRPRRRIWTLSLRALMVLILALGGLMGWKARRASLQRRGVAAVERLGGSVVYDWQYAGNAYLTTGATAPPGPDWLRRALGDEYFQEVAQVNLPSQIPFGPDMGSGPDAIEKWGEERKAFRARAIQPVDDDQLACLDGLDRLDGLVLQWEGGEPLKPEGLARLGRLTRLKELHFGKKFDAEAGACLGRLANLETLSLTLDWREGGDLACLDRMPKLRSLVLQGPLTDANLAHVGRRHRLETLTLANLSNRPIGEELARIRDLKSLKYLNLQGSYQLTDQAVAPIEGLTGLQTLFLSGEDLTDAGLARLRNLPNLVTLTIPRGRVSDQAIAEFKAARPGVALTISNFP